MPTKTNMEQTRSGGLADRVVGLFAPYNNGAMPKQIDQWYAHDVISHTADGRTIRGIAEFKDSMTETLAAFHNLRLTLDDIVVQGDREAHIWSYTATFAGPYGNIKPTGKKIAIPKNAVFQTWRDGKIAEIWWMDNTFAFLSQAGVLPPPPGQK